MEKLIEFDNWMRKIKSIHYSNNKEMINAYDKILENEHIQEA